MHDNMEERSKPQEKSCYMQTVYFCGSIVEHGLWRETQLFQIFTYLFFYLMSK